MTIALLVLLIGIYVTIGLAARRYGKLSRLFLLGVSTLIPGLAFFFI
jgi:hypothetical protein